MKVYIAALYSTMQETKAFARLVAEAGHEITARWLDGNEEGMSLQNAALMDVDDVTRADVLIFMALPYGTMFKGGGRCVELGLALGLGKRVFVVGECENIFCNLPQVTVCPTIGVVLSFLEVK